MNTIEANISDPDFSVEQLSDEMGMSSHPRHAPHQLTFSSRFIHHARRTKKNPNLRQVGI